MSGKWQILHTKQTNNNKSNCNIVSRVKDNYDLHGIHMCIGVCWIHLQLSSELSVALKLFINKKSHK